MRPCACQISRDLVCTPQLILCACRVVYTETRAIRRRLTANQSQKKTVRQAKIDSNFGFRKFALKA